MTSSTTLVHRCILLATIAASGSVLLASATSSTSGSSSSSSSASGFEPLPLKWRPFNVKNAGAEAAEEAAEGPMHWGQMGPHHPGLQQRGWAQPRLPMRAGEMKSFVDGLKSRIKSELSLLLALTDDDDLAEDLEAEEEAEEAGAASRNQLRDFFVADNAKMRKFMPLPLMKGSRN